MAVDPLFCVINGRTQGRAWHPLGGTGRAAPPRRRRRCASAHQLRGVHANALLREGVPLNVSNANSDAARWA